MVDHAQVPVAKTFVTRMLSTNYFESSRLRATIVKYLVQPHLWLKSNVISQHYLG